MPGVRVERLDHRGIGAGICRASGLTAYLERRACPPQQPVRIATAPVALIVHGLGFSHRRRDLVAQLLGAGITAAMHHDDCLGPTLDGLPAHAPTALCAGSAWPARPRGGLAARQMHVPPRSR
jgi:hypothetical protein